MMREKLPQRRFCETYDYEWEGIAFTVTYGRNAEGLIREVFCNCTKEGSTFALLLADTARILSIALQRGSTPNELLKSIGREPNNKPNSVIGYIITQMVKVSKLGVPELEKESA